MGFILSGGLHGAVRGVYSSRVSLFAVCSFFRTSVLPSWFKVRRGEKICFERRWYLLWSSESIWSLGSDLVRRGCDLELWSPSIQIWVCYLGFGRFGTVVVFGCWFDLLTFFLLSSSLVPISLEVYSDGLSFFSCWLGSSFEPCWFRIWVGCLCYGHGFDGKTELGLQVQSPFPIVVVAVFSCRSRLVRIAFLIGAEWLTRLVCLLGYDLLLSRCKGA